MHFALPFIQDSFVHQLAGPGEFERLLSLSDSGLVCHSVYVVAVICVLLELGYQQTRQKEISREIPAILFLTNSTFKRLLMRCETPTNRKLRINMNHESAPTSTAPAKSDNFFLQKTNTTAVEFRILLYLAKRKFFNHVATKISVERTFTALRRQWATERDFGIQYNTIQ